MSDAIRVMVLGTGQMGLAIARLVLEKEGLELAGAYARRGHREGLDLGQAIGHGGDLGIRIGADLATVVTNAQAHLAIQTTCSTLDDAKDEIITLLDHGIHVISIAEEMSYPACASAAIAQDIDRMAKTRSVAILGTGINPGFVFDFLIVTLTGVCAEVQSISAMRTNDLTPYGPTVLASQGVGLSPQEFLKGVQEGSVVGHIGFPESIHLIATSLSLDIGRIEEKREPIVSKVRRVTPFVTVEPGYTAGCLHTAVAFRDDKPFITLTHPQQIQPDLEGVKTGDMIDIKGTPDVRFSGSPEIPGGIGTAALAVNMIPRALNAAPGLHSMTDLPPPSAMMGDVRKLIHRTHPESRYV